MTIVTVTVT